MDSATISLIVPIFNTEKGMLRRAVESAINQSNILEILLVDDGSMRAVAILIDELADENPKIIKAFHKVNGGVSSARNAALKVAKGEYVAFLDADDYLSKDFFSEALKIADRTGAPVVMGGMAYHYLNGTVDEIGNRELGSSSVVLQSDELESLMGSLFNREALLRVGLKPAMYVSNCAAIYKKEVIENLYFDENITISEDRLFNYDVFNRCEKVAISGNIWYHYLQNSKSASQRLRPNAKEELAATAYVLEGLLDICPSSIQGDIQLGIEECLRQTIDFTILRRGFKQYFDISESDYISNLIQEPVYQRLYKSYKPSSFKKKLLKLLIEKKRCHIIVWMFKFNRFLFNLKHK